MRMTLLSPFAQCTKWLCLLLLYAWSGSATGQIISADIQIGIGLHLNGACNLEVAVSSRINTCDGATVCVKIAGGIAPYKVYLNGALQPATTVTGLTLCFQHLAPGNYSVKVTDAQNCSAGVAFGVPVVDYLLPATVKNVTCNGGADGTIDLKVPIDVAPIFYKWTGPNGYKADSEAIKNLKAGIYYVQVYGVNGICYGIGKWEITQPEPIKIDIVISTAACGTANVCALLKGGKAPYRIWGFRSLPGGVTADNFLDFVHPESHNPANATLYNPTTNPNPFCVNNLPAGNYYILVQDANGCYGWKIFHVSASARFERYLDVKDISCHGKQDGKICFKINGNTPPYKTTLTFVTANWIQTREGLSGCFENLPAGEYLLTTTDGSGCASKEQIKIMEPAPIEAEFVLEENDCRDGASGCLKGSGGTRPYRVVAYVHPNPTADEGYRIELDEQGVPYVVDAEIATAIKFPPAISLGGPFCARHIPPGDYILLVIDVNNCYKEVMVHIPESGGIRAELTVNSPTCTENASACLNIFGGAQPYRFFVWRHQDIAFNDTLDVNVDFDSEGRPYIAGRDFIPTDEVKFKQIPTLGPFDRYCAENVPPGYYVIVIVDKNGCHTVVKGRVPPPTNGIEAKFDLNGGACAGLANGCLTVQGGTQPYKVFVWGWNSPLTVIPQVRFDENGNPRIEGGRPTEWRWSTPGIAPLYQICTDSIPPGYYWILVVDTSGCYKLLPVNVPRGEGLELTTRVKTVTCNGDRDGQIYLVIKGGEQPYSIYLNGNSDTGRPINSSLTIVFDSLKAGLYKIEVKDKNGCRASTEVKLTEPEPLVAEFTPDQSSSCNAGSGGCVKVKGGTRPYKLLLWRWENPRDVLPTVRFNTTTNRFEIEGAVALNIQATPAAPNNDVWCYRQLPPGNYLVLIIDVNGCYTLLPIYIGEPNTLRLRSEIVNPACSATSAGTVKLYIAGGTPPYQVKFGDRSLTTNDSIVKFENILPGTYSIWVYDKLQCSADIKVVIKTPGIDANLRYDKYGSYACLNPSGGTPPYKIEWLNLETGAIVSNDTCVRNLRAGVYLVTIKDGAGCSVQHWLVIEPQVCKGGIATVNPESIVSGEETKFSLSGHIGVSIQWQFKTDFTEWISIPGATGESYPTPPIHTSWDKIIKVRAQVTCADGSIAYSTETAFKIRGNYLLTSIDARTEDPQLFNPTFRRTEIMVLQRNASQATDDQILVYPTISQDVVRVRLAASQQPVNIMIVNSLGSVVHQTKMEESVRGKEVELSVRQLANGTYFVRVESGSRVNTQRIVVQ